MVCGVMSPNRLLTLANTAASRRMRSERVKNAAWRGDLPRCRATAAPSGLVEIGAIELADAIVGQPGPCTDGVRARLVVDEAQREVEAQAVAAVAVVGDTHVFPCVCGFVDVRNLGKISQICK